MEPAGTRRSLGAAMRDALDNDVSRFPRPSHQPERIAGRARPTYRPSFNLQPGDRVFTIGSCFARNVEEHVAAAGFEVPPLDFHVPAGEWDGVRPNGILNKFSPTAIRTELELAVRGAHDEDAILRCLAGAGDDLVVDLQLAANRPVTTARGVARRREVVTLFGEAFDCDVVIITLGQTETWWDDAAGMHVNVFPPAAVHRRHPGRFYFDQLSYDRCLEAMQASIDLLLGRGRPKHVLLSVSPVPLGRTFAGGDALVAYIASKSVLRAVAETIVDRNPDVDYLPTYEAVMLTDRSIAFDGDLHVPDDLVADVIEHALAAYCAHPTTPV